MLKVDPVYLIQSAGFEDSDNVTRLKAPLVISLQMIDSRCGRTLLGNRFQKLDARCFRDHALDIDAGVVQDQLCSMTEGMLETAGRRINGQDAISE
jgi:hypothetical protein